MDLPSMLGLVISAVQFDRPSHQWTFRFGESCRANVSCPWRIVSEERVAITGSDHLQKFGLSEPVDSANTALRLLRGRKVVRAVLIEGTGDLRIVLEGDVSFETFTDSSGYEGGNLMLPTGEWIVLMGGGETAIFDPTARKHERS